MNNQQRGLVLIAATSVAATWLLVLAFLVFVAFGIATDFQPGRALIPGLLTLVGLLVLFGYTYLFIALRVRCPRCSYKFLKNPKGQGRVNFVYHPDLPKLCGIDPWGYQIARFLGTRQMRCINCGDELFS